MPSPTAQVVRLYDYGFTRCVETDIAHSDELSALLWGRNTGVHFESAPASEPVLYDAQTTVTDLPGALAFIEEVKAETVARAQAQRAALSALYGPAPVAKSEAA